MTSSLSCQKAEETDLLEANTFSSFGTISPSEKCVTEEKFFSVPTVCIFILCVELCERLSYYTFAGTAEFFYEKTGYTLSEANGLTSAMTTLCMAFTVVAGWLADAVIGRYRTIFYLSLLYVLGTLLATIAAHPKVMSNGAYVVAMFIFIPLGTAGIKSNISNFGADQYDTSDPSGITAQQDFFQWFYMSINIGSALAFGLLCSLATNGGLGVPRDDGYFVAYSLAAGSMLLAVTLFASQRSSYRRGRLQESFAMVAVARHALSAARNGSVAAACFVAGSGLMAATIVLSVATALLLPGADSNRANSFLFVTFACAAIGITSTIFTCSDPEWVETSDLTSRALSTRETKDFLRLLPVILTANLAFGCIYNCMAFSFQQQACQMNLEIPFFKSDQFAGSFFSISDCLGITIATPISVWLNPKLESVLGHYFKFSGKFFLGMVFGASSVLVASVLEIFRRRATVMSQVSNCAPPGVHMSDLSASYMLIPYFLMGIAEIYTTPTMMHFCYSKCTPATRTLAVVTSFLSYSITNALFGVLTAALRNFMPNDLNRGHLEYAYYICLVTGFFFFLTFLYSMRLFHIQPLYSTSN